MKKFIMKLKKKRNDAKKILECQKKMMELEEAYAICLLDCLKKKIELEKIEKLLNEEKTT